MLKIFQKIFQVSFLLGPLVPTMAMEELEFKRLDEFTMKVTPIHRSTSPKKWIDEKRIEEQIRNHLSPPKYYDFGLSMGLSYYMGEESISGKSKPRKVQTLKEIALESVIKNYEKEKLSLEQLETLPEDLKDLLPTNIQLKFIFNLKPFYTGVLSRLDPQLESYSKLALSSKSDFSLKLDLSQLVVRENSLSNISPNKLLEQ